MSSSASVTSGKKRAVPTSPLTPPPTTKRLAQSQSYSRSLSPSPIGQYPTIEIATATLTNTFNVLKNYEYGLLIRYNILEKSELRQDRAKQDLEEQRMRVQKRERDAEIKERDIEENEVRAKKELWEERKKVQKRERDVERRERETEEYEARARLDLEEVRMKVQKRERDMERRERELQAEMERQWEKYRDGERERARKDFEENRQLYRQDIGKKQKEIDQLKAQVRNFKDWFEKSGVKGTRMLETISSGENSRLSSV
ncbi:hypothetical protein BDD12DRAFT_984339 [Trichophaea hybrida]|nr:hypothetical protein BDD12DRAFT_984339 [Trichophaea hybrida]